MTDFNSAHGSRKNIGFITLGAEFKWGVNKIGPMVENELSMRELFEKLDTLDDISERLSVIQELAPSLSIDEYHRFIDALVDTLMSGTLDVTGWNKLAVKAAIVVCSERDLAISFKNGDRIISPVSYPNTDPLLDMFADSVMTGKWFEKS